MDNDLIMFDDFVLFGFLPRLPDYDDFRNWLMHAGIPEDADGFYREADVARYRQDCDGAALTGDLFAPAPETAA